MRSRIYLSLFWYYVEFLTIFRPLIGLTAAAHDPHKPPCRNSPDLWQFSQVPNRGFFTCGTNSVRFFIGVKFSGYMYVPHLQQIESRINLLPHFGQIMFFLSLFKHYGLVWVLLFFTVINPPIIKTLPRFVITS